MITDAGKWPEISDFRHLSCLVTGLFSVPSIVFANDCRLCWQRAVFLPASFQADDDQSLFKSAVIRYSAPFIAYLPVFRQSIIRTGIRWRENEDRRSGWIGGSDEEL
jgi:hypothetical protein